MSILFRPFWYCCFITFLLHQVSQKVLHWKIPFADNYLDDLLCMPIFLGLLLVERQFLLQKRQFTFPLLDTLVMTLFLSFVFEFLFPQLSPNFTKDNWDFVCYFIGGIYFYFFVNVSSEVN